MTELDTIFKLAGPRPRRWSAYAMAQKAARCYQCHGYLPEHVYRVRVKVGRGYFGTQNVLVPLCAACILEPQPEWNKITGWDSMDAELCAGGCGRWVTDTTQHHARKATVCSELCRTRAAAAARAADYTPVQCAACDKVFAPTRSDAAYCSNACRQAAYRARRVA